MKSIINLFVEKLITFSYHERLDDFGLKLWIKTSAT